MIYTVWDKLILRVMGTAGGFSFIVLGLALFQIKELEQETKDLRRSVIIIESIIRRDILKETH